MAHIFDVMAKVCSQLSNISKYYSGDMSTIRTIPEVPNFIIVSINRSLDYRSDLIIDENAETGIEAVIKAIPNGDIYNPIYIAVASNLRESVVDKVPVAITNNKGNVTIGTGYVIIVPECIFKVNDKNLVSKVLSSLYFDILNIDKSLSYKADTAIIKYSESGKINVNTYDLTMVYSALGFVNIDLNEWDSGVYKSDKSFSWIDATFTEKQLPRAEKIRVAEALDDYATGINTLRDGVGDGSILRSAIYE